jgi:two-component system response regulator AtoC
VTLRLLIIDDEPNFRDFLAEALAGEGFAVKVAGTARAGLALAQQYAPHIVLLDQKLPDASGLDVLGSLRCSPGVPVVILMTAFAEYALAVSAVKAGAFDYLTKPFEFNDLLDVLEAARRTLPVSGPAGSDPVPELVGTSAAMRALKAQIVRVARSPVETVLVVGESGTGKELVARALHAASTRATQRLLSVNCAALPESLLLNELFGHERGAYTDARQQSRGVFEAASGGTLFLDEISEMAPAAQAALLRVLEHRVITRLGGTREIAVDVRIIAATNRDIEAAMAEGRFRADVYYRLNIVQLALPPLRERGDDVLLLARHFATELAAHYGEAPRRLSADALVALRAYDWPGNVRELRNAIERAYVVGTGPEITAADVAAATRPTGSAALRIVPGTDGVLPFPEAKRQVVDAFERAYLEAVLDRAEGNVTRAAREAGVLRQVFQRLLDRHGLHRRQGDARAG